jgi:hypothetical protein
MNVDVMKFSKGWTRDGARFPGRGGSTNGNLCIGGMLLGGGLSVDRRRRQIGDESCAAQ